jgi:hypothetical protein
VCILRERALSKCIRVNKNRLIEGLSVKSVVRCRVRQNLANIFDGHSTNIYAKIIKRRFKID